MRARLVEVHALLRAELPGILRIGVAIHEARSGMLRTLLHSTVGPAPFDEYALPLAESPSLVELAQSGGKRVIDDLADLPEPQAWHTRALRNRGLRSSYTRPFFRDGRLAGFLFFDAALPGYFGADVLRRLGPVADHLARIVLHGLDVVRVLEAALRTGTLLTRFRDAETADHVERVARSVRILAWAVGPRWGFSEEKSEALALFSVAHDIGKVAIPESLIGKDGPLDDGETEQMKVHTTAGAAIVEGIITSLGIEDHEHLGMLRNVVRSHHELRDGSGYPDGLAGDAIPQEARIVAVADVYDALRSARRYKEAWSEDLVLAYLRSASGTHLDPEVVAAALAHAADLDEIHRGAGAVIP